MTYCIRPLVETNWERGKQIRKATSKLLFPHRPIDSSIDNHTTAPVNLLDRLMAETWWEE